MSSAPAGRETKHAGRLHLRGAARNPPASIWPDQNDETSSKPRSDTGDLPLGLTLVCHCGVTSYRMIGFKPPKVEFTQKAQLVASLGQRGLLRPAWVTEALRANDIAMALNAAHAAVAAPADATPFFVRQCRKSILRRLRKGQPASPDSARRVHRVPTRRQGTHPCRPHQRS